MTPELVEASRAGSAHAFRTLVRTVEPQLRRWALDWVGGDRDAADDITQEALVSLHCRLDSLRDPEALMAWLRTLIRNASLDLHRREAGRRRYETEFAASVSLVSGAPSPLDRVTQRALGERAVAEVRRLPGAQRRVLVLVALHGMSAPEVAERTGTRPATVRAHLSRGRAALRRRWDDRADPAARTRRPPAHTPAAPNGADRAPFTQGGPHPGPGADDEDQARRNADDGGDGPGHGGLRRCRGLSPAGRNP